MAIEGAEKVLQGQHVEAEQKHAYFLLGATGTAVGFVVQKLENQRFDLAGVVLLAAAAALLLSFLFGIRFLEQVNRARRHNLRLVQARKEFRPQTAQELEIVQQALADEEKAMDRANSKAGSFKKWQFRGLILGPVLLIAWRVITMANHC